MVCNDKRDGSCDFVDRVCVLVVDLCQQDVDGGGGQYGCMCCEDGECGGWIWDVVIEAVLGFCEGVSRERFILDLGEYFDKVCELQMSR